MDELDEVTNPEDEENLKFCVENIVKQGKQMAEKQAARAVKFVVDAPLFKTNVSRVRSLTGHIGKVYALQWASDSRHVLTASQDGKVFLFDALTQAKDCVFRLESPFVMCAAINAQQKLVCCGGLDNALTVYDVADAQKESMDAASKPKGGDSKAEPHAKTSTKAVLQGHEGYLSCLRFLGNDHVLSASGDQTIIRWDLGQERKVQTFHGHLEDVSSVALVDKDQGIFVTGSVDHTVKLWDARVATPVMTLYGHTAEVHSVETTGGLTGMIASCSDNGEDGSVRVWDYRATSLLVKFQCDQQNDEKGARQDDEKRGSFVGSAAVAFTASGRGLVAGFNDGDVRIFDVLTGLTAQTLHFSSHSRVSCLGVAPDGRAIAVAGWDVLYQKGHNGPGPAIYA